MPQVTVTCVTSDCTVHVSEGTVTCATSDYTWHMWLYRDPQVNVTCVTSDCSVCHMWQYRVSRLAVHRPSNTVISCTSEKFPVTRSRRHFKQRLVCIRSQAFKLERNVHKHNVYVKRARQSNLIQRSNYLDFQLSSFTN